MEMCKREGCRNVSYLSLCYLHSSWLKNTTGTVAIPTHFYKIITRCDGSKTPYYETPNCQGRLDVISFILPHSAKSICKVSSVFCVIIKIDRYCFTRCMVGYHNLFETTCCVPVVFCTSEEIIVDTRTLKLKARKLWRAIIGIKKTLISTNEWINQSINGPSVSQDQTPEEYLMDHVATVRDIELLTGINFFSSLRPEEQARIKTISPVKLWN